MLVTLPAYLPLPHQVGLALSTRRWSGAHDSSTKGPVPSALRCEKGSSLVLMSLGATALFFSAQALLRMRSSVSWFTSTGLGTSEKMSMVWASTFSTRSMPWV